MTDFMHLSSIAAHIPAQRRSNTERLTEFNVTPEFLKNKIGVFERSIKEPHETTSDLCVAAFAKLVEKSSFDPAAVGIVCVVTQNPDRKIPHTAAIVHQKLGLSKRCLTFDVSQGCAGYTHGLAIVSALAEKLSIGDALLFTCDPYSTIVDPNDKSTALIFGDAASVSHLSRKGPGYVLVDSDFGTVPNSYECLTCEDTRLKMDGRVVFSHAAREVPESIRRLLDRHGLGLADVDRFLLHPGSKYIVDFLRQALGLEPEKVPFDITRHGNTVSSSIPILLEQCMAEEKHPRIVLSGFGVGFSWGSNLMEFRF